VSELYRHGERATRALSERSNAMLGGLPVFDQSVFANREVDDSINGQIRSEQVLDDDLLG
jgi:hypothetical protein